MILGEEGQPSEPSAFKVGDVVALEVFRAEPGTQGPIFVVSRDGNGKVVLFDKNIPLSYKLKSGQIVESKISKDFGTYYFAQPLRILKDADDSAGPASAPSERMIRAIEALEALEANEKVYFLGLLELPFSSDWLDRKLTRLRALMGSY